MNYKFIKDQLTEEVGGKYSSKKFWGAVIMVLVCGAYILDGFKFYTANETLFYYMLGAGCLLLGLNVISKFKKPNVGKES